MHETLQTLLLENERLFQKEAILTAQILEREELIKELEAWSIRSSDNPPLEE